MRLLLALAILPCVSTAQIDPTVKADETNLPVPSHCGDRADLPMSHKDKLCYWWSQSFNAQMIFGAAFTSALDPLLNGSTNAYWGQGVEGYSRRFGTRVSQSMAKGTGQALVGMAFKEDPRFYQSRKEGFWPRFGFALSHTLIVRHDDGKQFLSAGRIAGAFSSGFVGMAWTPDPINTPQDALVRSGTAMGGVLAGSLWTEFQPDVMNLVSSIFRKPPKAPKTSLPKKTVSKRTT
jgi:hypothetical protein